MAEKSIHIHCGNCFHMKVKFSIKSGVFLYGRGTADCEVWKLPAVRKNGRYNVGKQSADFVYPTWIEYANQCDEYA